MIDFERPIRVPAHIPLSIAQPPVARAGERSRWRLPFQVDEPVKLGELLGVQFQGGRFNKLQWPHLQGDAPHAEGYVAVQIGEQLLGLEAADGDVGSFYFRAPAAGIPAGATIIVHLGGEKGAVAPPYALPNKFFLLFRPDPAPKPPIPGVRQDPGREALSACLMRVTGNKTHHLRVIAPSFATAGEPIRVLVRPEDSENNVACDPLPELTLRLDGEVIHAHRVEGEATNCVWLDEVVLPRPGVHRLAVTARGSGWRAASNPIHCHEEPPPLQPLWGMIHAHAELSDGSGDIAHYYNYMRDEAGLDFGALTEHDHVSETPDEYWRLIQEFAEERNQPGRFVAFLAYEWAKWVRKGYGDRNVYYLHDRRPIYRSEEADYPHPTDLFRALQDETAIIIPHHPASNGNHCDWRDHEPEKERLVEIYSSWGSSERSVHDGNPLPIRPAKKVADPPLDAGEVPAGFVQRALELGWRVGFTGGGDDHYGHPGDNIRIGWPPFQYQAGLMAAWAGERNRASIWEALWQRRTYATTGARIIVRFTLDGHEMGSILTLNDAPRLEMKRRIRVEAHGAAAIEKIEIVRNNQDVHVQDGGELDMAFVWEDREALSAINLPPARWSANPFTFYYVRVIQSDGEMAWASPIWIESW